MEKGRKNMLIAAGAAFVGGVAVTLTVLALAFCPAKRHGMWHGGWHRDMPRAEMRLPTRHHPEGRFDGERHREWKYRADRGDAPRRFGHPGFHPERALKHRFAEKLQLTDEQKAQIEQFRKEDMAQMEPLFKQMDDLRAKADKLREENKARFESVLTDEQKEILAAMHERRAEMRGRRAEMNGVYRRTGSVMFTEKNNLKKRSLQGRKLFPPSRPQDAAGYQKKPLTLGSGAFL